MSENKEPTWLDRPDAPGWWWRFNELDLLPVFVWLDPPSQELMYKDELGSTRSPTDGLWCRAVLPWPPGEKRTS